MVDKTTSDNPADLLEQGGDKPEYVSKEEFSRVLNAAITNRMKGLDKQLEVLTTAMARLAPPPVEEKPEKVTNSEMAEMKKQMDAMRKERDQERDQRRSQDLRRQVQEKLVAKGVKQELIPAAMAKLIDADKTISYDENDQIVFKSQEGPVGLDDGVNQWYKSEGFHYSSPKGVQGAGMKTINKNTSSQGNSEAELDARIINGLKDLL